MITENDLNTAIAECQGKKNPDAKTCIMLAAFYTIRREMYGEPQIEAYSYAPAPESAIEINSDSEFAQIVNGKQQKNIMPVIDELMDVLSIIQPRLYNAVIEKLS